MVSDEEFREVKENIKSIETRLSKLEEILEKISNQPTIQVKKISAIEINVGELSFIKRLKSVLDKCLGLLNYVSEKYPQHPGLTTDEIKNIFGDKFGLTTVTINNISMSLKNVTGTYVVRNKIEDKTIKYVYQILPEGKDYINKKIEQLNKV